MVVFVDTLNNRNLNSVAFGCVCINFIPNGARVTNQKYQLGAINWNYSEVFIRMYTLHRTIRRMQALSA